MNKILGLLIFILVAYMLLMENGPDVQPENEVIVTPPVPKALGTWPYLKESGNPQISDDLLRTNVYVVLDGSGSMEDSGCSDGKQKIDAAKQALTDFGATVPKDANLGVYAFDSHGISERAPLSRGTRASFVKAVNGVRSGGSTPLKTAIKGAYKQLTKQARAQLGYGTYHLVVVTDGEADKGENPRKVVDKILDNSPVIVHTIGFCINSSHSLNQAGRVLYHTANDYAGLKAGLNSVLAESDQFTVANF